MTMCLQFSQRRKQKLKDYPTAYADAKHYEINEHFVDEKIPILK